MKTITLLPERDYTLVENEIYIYNQEDGEKGKIISSTANLEGVKQLDRTLFMKKEDVEELANTEMPKDEDNNPLYLYEWNDGFIAGYNANKGEFTREDMFEAMKYASAHLSSVKGIAAYIANLPKLSLPKSITVDESYNVIKVNR